MEENATSILSKDHEIGSSTFQWNYSYLKIESEYFSSIWCNHVWQLSKLIKIITTELNVFQLHLEPLPSATKEHQWFKLWKTHCALWNKSFFISTHIKAVHVVWTAGARFSGKKKVIDHKMRFWFCIQLLSEKFLILRRIQWATITNVHKSSCKVPIILSDFNETWIVSKDFFKKYSNIKFHDSPSTWSKVAPCGHTDRRIDTQTGMTKLIVAFCILWTHLKPVINYFSCKNVPSALVTMRSN